MRVSRVLLLLLCSFGLCGCAQVFDGGDSDIVRGFGTVVYVSVEGGFYEIVKQDGDNYDPINLPRELWQDGLPVWFMGRLRPDLVSSHMSGPLIELLEIREVRRP